MQDITVVITVSPVPTHPSPELVIETLDEIRRRLPKSEVIIVFDAPSSQVMHLKDAYEQFLADVLWRINLFYVNVTPVVFDTHHHQSLMLKAIMPMIRSPLILWSEQDTPLFNEIPFSKLSKVILSGYANVIRFHHEASIHPEHKYLMLDETPQFILGVPLLRTKQWSSRPHLASKKFYEHVIKHYWPKRPMFTEHILYGVIVEGDYEEFGLHIYAPRGGYVRHKHTDGRRKGAGYYDPAVSS